MIPGYLSTSPIFSEYLERFLINFNSEIKWSELIKEWKIKNKNEEQILNSIKPKCWIDQSIEYNENKLEKFRFIRNLFIDLKPFDKIYILKPNYEKTSMKIEQEFELYRNLIETYLKSHLINYEYINKLEKDKQIFDFGWIFLNKSELEKLWKMKNIIHFNIYSLNKNIKIEFIEELIKIYKFIRNDF